MAPKRVILESSAQPWAQKRTTLTQELIRRLLNCSRELSCGLKRKHLNMFMQQLKNSGYGEKFRAKILKSVIAGYNEILAADKAGGRPIYRVGGSRMAPSKKAQKEKLVRSVLEIMHFCPIYPWF